jgi:histidinol-phosphate phosphatase family protein
VRRRDVIILDRDGTFLDDPGYLDDPAALRFLPGAGAALRCLHERGYRLVVITNQSGVGRGLFSLARLQEIHRRLTEMVEEAGSRLEGIYACPHVPDAGCDCRKPQDGLFRQAASELGFEASSAIVIGDRLSDMLLGRRVGAPAILVGGDPAATAAADFVAADLAAAVEVVEELNAAGSAG